MFAGVIFLLSFLQYESPRYLIKRGQVEKAKDNLSHLSHLPPDHGYIVHVINSIQRAHEIEMEATMGTGLFGVIKEAFLFPSNLYRIYLSFMCQVLSQWTGAGSITLYATDLFHLLGITGSNTNLLVIGIFGIVKFIAAIICALFLVNSIRRKRSLLLSITLQAISIVYVTYFLTTIPKIGVEDGFILPASKKNTGKEAITIIYISRFRWALG